MFFLCGKWMVCTIHLAFPGRMTHPPWRSTGGPRSSRVARQINKASLWKGHGSPARGGKPQNTNEGAFLPSDGSVPNWGLGRLDQNQARFWHTPHELSGRAGFHRTEGRTFCPPPLPQALTRQPLGAHCKLWGPEGQSKQTSFLLCT